MDDLLGFSDGDNKMVDDYVEVMQGREPKLVDIPSLTDRLYYFDIDKENRPVPVNVLNKVRNSYIPFVEHKTIIDEIKQIQNDGQSVQPHHQEIISRHGRELQQMYTEVKQRNQVPMFRNVPRRGNRNEDDSFFSFEVSSGSFPSFASFPGSFEQKNDNPLAGIFGMLGSFLNQNVPTPLTKKSFDSLEEKKYADVKTQDGESCTVCLGPYEDNDIVKITPCNHVFHPECLKGWIKENHTCPVCRESLGECSVPR